MNAKQIIKTLNLTGAHSLYREDGLWYHHLKKFPGILFDSTGYILIETEEAYQANPHLQHAKDLHVTNGISNIPGYVYFSDEQKFKLAIIDADAKDNESIIRKKRLIDVFLRNKVIVRKVKNLYSNRCQICGLQLKIKENQYYSEVHHIVPLGNPHNGLDNMKKHALRLSKLSRST